MMRGGRGEARELTYLVCLVNGSSRAHSGNDFRTNEVPRGENGGHPASSALGQMEVDRNVPVADLEGPPT